MGIKRMFSFVKKMEFSKVILAWAMSISTICILGFSIGFYWKGILPDSLVSLIGTILTGTVLAYMGKALVENINKNKTNQTDQMVKNENDKGENIGVIDTSFLHQEDLEDSK